MKILPATAWYSCLFWLLKEMKHLILQQEKKTRNSKWSSPCHKTSPAKGWLSICIDIPRYLSSSPGARCVLEWHYRSELNTTHFWEGRHCADIAIEGVSGEESHEDEEEEYANNELFTVYEDIGEAETENISSHMKLMNEYKVDNITASEPKILHSKTQVAATRQMDIPLPADHIFENNFGTLVKKKTTIKFASPTTLSTTTLTTIKATTKKGNLGKRNGSSRVHGAEKAFVQFVLIIISVLSCYTS